MNTHSNLQNVLKITNEKYGSYIVDESNTNYYVPDYRQKVEHTPPAFCFKDIVSLAAFLGFNMCSLDRPKILILKAVATEARETICSNTHGKMFDIFWSEGSNVSTPYIIRDNTLVQVRRPPTGTVFCTQTEFVTELEMPSIHWGGVGYKYVESRLKELNKKKLEDAGLEQLNG